MSYSAAEKWQKIGKVGADDKCTAPKILDKYDWLKQHQGLYVYERLEADHPSSI